MSSANETLSLEHAQNLEALLSDVQPIGIPKEILMLRKMFEQYKADYPYIDGYQYISGNARGGLLLTDGKDNYLIVEAKHLSYRERDRDIRQRAMLSVQKAMLSVQQSARACLGTLRASRKTEESGAITVYNATDGTMEIHTVTLSSMETTQ